MIRRELDTSDGRHPFRIFGGRELGTVYVKNIVSKRYFITHQNAPTDNGTISFSPQSQKRLAIRGSNVAEERQILIRLHSKKNRR